MEALSIAAACIELGARLRTVVRITGLHRSVVDMLMQKAGRRRVCGQPPTKSDHVFLSSQARRLEVSYLLNVFGSMLEAGNSPGLALVAAYRRYLTRFEGTGEGRGRHGEVVSFDRAFDFVARTYCLWGHSEASLVMVRCRRCGARYVSTPIAEGGDDGECPCCRLAHRYKYSDKVRRYVERLDKVDPQKGDPAIGGDASITAD